MISLLAVLLSALAYVVAFPPHDVSVIAFVALAPLAWVLRECDAARALGWAGTWGFLATAGIVVWLVPTGRDYFGLSPLAGVAFLVVVAALAAAPQIALLFGLLGARRIRAPFAWPFLFAFAWVASEWLRTETGLESPWGRLGDTQHASPRIRQSADLCGVYGISFLLALGNGVAAEVARLGWQRLRRTPDTGNAGDNGEWKQLLPAGLAFTLLLISALAYGELQIERWDRTEKTLDVVLVQGNVPQELRWSRARGSQVVRRYIRLTREAMRAGDPDRRPDLIVWPENAIQTSLTDPTYGETTRRLSTDLGIPLLIGAPRSEVSEGTTRHFNSALFLSPDGNVSHYDKRKLLLFSERSVLPDRGSAPQGPIYSKGQSPAYFQVSDVVVSTLICMEALYPALARELASAGASVIVNLSNDGWFRGTGAGEQHFAQVRFRAIETRLPVLRATTSGITAVIGPDGRIDSRLGPGEESWLRTRVPPGAHEATLYTRAGDVVPIGALLLCLACALPLRRVPSGN